MMASPDCRSLYKALGFLVVSGQRISARAVDRGTQFLVQNCRSLQSGEKDIVAANYQEALLGTIFGFPPEDSVVKDVQPSI